MGSIIVVQEIRTEWTKASRGGKNAEKRNTVPEVASVPVQNIVENNLFLVHHRLGFDEYTGFFHAHEEVHVNPAARPLVIGCATIDFNEEKASIAFRWNYRCGGAPDRSWAQKTLHVARNAWGQIVYNGRFSNWEDTWHYEKRVINVGVCERLTPGLFTQHESACRFQAMGVLF